MFEIFAGVYGKGDAIWLECAETLPLAKQRVNEIAAAKPGSYFVFDLSIATAEGLLYEVHATLLIERRSLEMEQARKEWPEELKQTLALFRDLNVTPASPDGNLALRNARLNESRALQKYKAAVAAYVEELRANR